MTLDEFDTIRPIIWKDDNLYLLDQRLLPKQEIYLKLDTVDAVADAIRDMVVRGAPAIGITAAFGVVVAARIRYQESVAHWRELLEPDLDLLAVSRPTAINLFWALKIMHRFIDAVEGDPFPVLLAEAQRIHQQDIVDNRKMGELGANLIGAEQAVLTHCNTGSLATGGFGTALGVIRTAWAMQQLSAVYADETRPWLQGSRLTAWELVHDKIPVTLIAEGAVSTLMRQDKVQWFIVGSDRIAANGDVANKIGTYAGAVQAKHHGVKVMVVAPTSTIDMSVANGAAIPIENRTPDELLAINGSTIAAEGSSAWNPVFDVTPASLVDFIVTEKGIVEAPTAAKMRALMTQ